MVSGAEVQREQKFEIDLMVSFKYFINYLFWFDFVCFKSLCFRFLFLDPSILNLVSGSASTNKVISRKGNQDSFKRCSRGSEASSIDC